MARTPLRWLLLAAALLPGWQARGAAPPPSGRGQPAAVAAEIDRLIDAGLRERKIAPSPAADDAEFLRRACLDITGKIPTPERAAAFLDGKDARKREKLIDELLASPDHGRHFANTWHDLIVPRTPLPGGTDPEALRRAFEECFNNGTPWGETVSRLILARGATKEKNFHAFYRVNGDMGGQPMANVVARSFNRLFLGVKMECAECHDDPYKPWTQRQYWGMAAFFGRIGPTKRGDFRAAETTGYKTPKGNNFRLVVGKDGALAIHLEAWKNVGKPVRPQLPGGPPLSFSRGEPMLPTFAAWATAPGNPYFARATANRVWAQLMGRGLVNPVDDFHEGNPPSHPQLLVLLAGEFTRSGGDTKHLVRCVCNSRAYQRTSRPFAGNEKFEDARFARMPLRPLTAEMLLESLGVAYGKAELLPREVKKPGKKRPGRVKPAGPVRADFIRLFATNDVDGDPTLYSGGIPQALHLMNAPLFNAGGEAVGRLLDAKLSPEQAIERLYLGALSRRPTAAELKRKLALLKKHKTTREGLNGVLWALVNSSEFAINH